MPELGPGLEGSSFKFESPTAAGGPLRGGKDRFTGLNGEKWSRWIVPGGMSEYNGIASPDLKTLVRSLARRPTELTSPEKLSEFYDQLESLEGSLKSNPKALAQLGDYMDRIAERAYSIISGGGRVSGEKRQSLIEVPLYFGAVFEGGKNYVHVDRSDLIPTLDVTKKEDRTKFIFKNIHAFDYRFQKASAWKGAITDWIADFNIANEGANLNSKESDEFLKQLKAMMAVTASARAMEGSAGVAKNYMEILVGLDPKGNPNLDEQDTSSSLLLHADPEKMKLILENPLVKTYYDRLMKDAGLVNDANHEWREITDPEGKKTWVSSTVELVREAKKLREGQPHERSKLLKYVEKEADNGGFQGYIEQVLLGMRGQRISEHDRDVRMAAARIACDLFLVDKWTRWEDELQEHDKKGTDGKPISLKLQPQKEWGGNPLKSVIKPTFLPRLKKVYTKEDEAILDLVDKALRPMDIFNQYKGITEIHPVVPSMVTNLKTFSRISDATYKVFGGSMATGLPNWNRDAMEELPQIADLLTQVYGNLTTKEGTGAKRSEVPIGKHIVGAMMMRLLCAKALATTIESSKPGFSDNLQIIFDPQNRNRPFLEVMQGLYGPKLDARSGFIQSLAGGRTRLILKGNRFGADKDYHTLWQVLNTNDQGGGRGAGALNTLGFVLDVLSSVGKNTGVIKSK